TWIIYLLMAMFIFFLIYKRPVYLFAGFGFTLILCISQLSESFSINSQKKIIVYNVSKKSAIDLIDSRENYFIAPRELVNDQSAMMFCVNHNQWALGLEETKNINSDTSYFKNQKVFIKNNFIQFFDKRILVLK